MILSAQARVRGLLEAMLAKGTLPPSILITGPEGSGKELIAVGLAAMLNCDGAAHGCDPPCPACARTGRLEHPDLHLVYPVPYGEGEKGLRVVLESRREDFFAVGEFGNRARSIGIDHARDVIEAVSKQPFEGASSVVLLLEAHLATVEAQNAILKLLEEPPRHAVLVLVTDHPDRLLPTVVSRCQEVRSDELSADVVAAFLARFYSVEEQEARRLSGLADGNLRRAIRFLDERFLRIRNDAVTIMKLAFDGKAKELLGESEAIARGYSRDEVDELLEEAAIVVHRLMRSAGERISDKGGAGATADAGRNLPDDLRKIHRAAENLRRNADVELTLSQLLLDLAGEWY